MPSYSPYLARDVEEMEVRLRERAREVAGKHLGVTITREELVDLGREMDAVLKKAAEDFGVPVLREHFFLAIALYPPQLGVRLREVRVVLLPKSDEGVAWAERWRRMLDLGVEAEA